MAYLIYGMYASFVLVFLASLPEIEEVKVESPDIWGYIFLFMFITCGWFFIFTWALADNRIKQLRNS